MFNDLSKIKEICYPKKKENSIINLSSTQSNINLTEQDQLILFFQENIKKMIRNISKNVQEISLTRSSIKEIK